MFRSRPPPTLVKSTSLNYPDSSCPIICHPTTPLQYLIVPEPWIQSCIQRRINTKGKLWTTVSSDKRITYQLQLWCSLSQLDALRLLLAQTPSSEYDVERATRAPLRKPTKRNVLEIEEVGTIYLNEMTQCWLTIDFLRFRSQILPSKYLMKTPLPRCQQQRHRQVVFQTVRTELLCTIITYSLNLIY